MTALADNRKALFDYEIIEKFTAGIELVGAEVKSVRGGQMSLRGSFVVVRGGEAYLMHSTIPPYQPKNTPKDYEPTRERKLLLSKKELEKLAESEKTKGLTIVPLSVYNKGRFLKVDIAVVRGKKQYDKRQAIKKRDTERSEKNIVIFIWG